MHDTEERFTYAGKSGLVEPLERGPALKYDREIGSHTKANVANESQPVPNAPAHGFNVWIRPSGPRPIGANDRSGPQPYHIAATYQTDAEAHNATQEIAAGFGGQQVQVMVLPTDFYPLPDGTIRPTTDNVYGKSMEVARGTDAVGERLGPWGGPARNSR